MRLLISIGCDTYTHLNSLHGAELDAKRFYESMIRDNIGEYNIEHSILLLSPGLTELRGALHHVLVRGEGEIDTLTFFFAGHGGTKSGSYYLCLRDSEHDMLSTSAFGMSELFAILNENHPRQSNLIVDACQGGGIVADLHAIVKPEVMGSAETPGVSIFVSSGADQYAVDGSDGGTGTISLMRCIDGTDIVQTTRPTLDLLEAGRVASLHMAHHDPHQTPLLWGLNLYGEARFCKNPHYGGVVPALGALPRVATGTEADVLIRQRAEDIWRVYFSVLDDFSPRRLTDLIVPIASALSAKGGGSGEFACGLADACVFRAEDATDMFRPSEVMSACIVGLLEEAGMDDVDRAMLDMTKQLLSNNNQALSEISQNLSDDKYALLSGGGYADLFYLPLRLCRILGWIGAQHFIRAWIGRQGDSSEDEMLKRLVQQILGTYSSSLVALSEVQSPYLLIFFSCCRERGWIHAAEVVFGHLFNDFVRSGGKIAQPDIDPDRVFEFLMRRVDGRYCDAFDMFSHPGEMLSTLLLAARWFGLEDVIDPHLQALDHYSFNVFYPSDHRRFAKSTVYDGVNHTYKIGHGIWSAADFYGKWRGESVREILADTHLSEVNVKTGALLAALLFPDRCPWFVAVGADSNGPYSDGAS